MGLKKSYPPVHSTHEIMRDNVSFVTCIETSSLTDSILLTQVKAGTGEEVGYVRFNQHNAAELAEIFAEIARCS